MSKPDLTWDNTTTKPTIILISGYKGSGKSTVASKLLNILPNSSIKAFADPLKLLVAKTFDISLEELDLYKNNPSDYKVQLPTKYTDFRTILQRMGTEAAHEVFGKQVWVNLFIQDLVGNYIIVPDFRYDTEYYLLLGKYFKCVHIAVTDGTASTDTHKSEQLPTVTTHVTLDNSAKDSSIDATILDIKEYLDI